MTEGTVSDSSGGRRHIVLTSHPRPGRPKPPKVKWGAPTPEARGPIIGTLSDAAGAT